MNPKEKDRLLRLIKRKEGFYSERSRNNKYSKWMRNICGQAKQDFEYLRNIVERMS